MNSTKDVESLDIRQRLYVSRRDFLRISSMFGVTSTLMAAAGMAGIITAPGLAKAANSVYEKRFKTPAKYNLKFGGADKDARMLLMNRIGFLDSAATSKNVPTAPCASNT